jgi:hypothetical protein
MVVKASETVQILHGYGRGRARGGRAVSDMLIFLLGALLGVVLGSMLCVGYLRREIAADVGPKLKRIQLQLDNVEGALNLAITTRYAELITRSAGDGPPQIS